MLIVVHEKLITAAFFCVAACTLILGLQMQPASAIQSRFGTPLPGVTESERRFFRQGIGMFAVDWDTDPGAAFNATACRDCHSAPSIGGTTRDHNLTVRMVQDKKALAGFVPDPKLIQEKNGQVSQRSAAKNYELRRTPHLYGAGLLEAIPQSSLIKLSDPNDKNGDGISGRFLDIGGKIGRFGWKAAVPDLDEFCRIAFLDELGVSTVQRSKGHEVTLDMNQVRRTALFLRLLAPPPDRSGNATFEPGRKVFSQIGCASCHTPQQTTGDSEYAALKFKDFSPYTDLLLHDVGPGADVKDVGSQAGSREYRTAPLWGIGSIGGPYWHDASAKTIEEAIEKHEGEALKSRNRFRDLTEQSRLDLMEFLRSL